MNIFALDKNPLLCAKYHCDDHVIKMILEHAQMMCTAIIAHGGKAPYKPTHRNHPCTLWVMKSASNFQWLQTLNYWLNEEFKIRNTTTKDHLAYTKTKNLILPSSYPFLEMTPFAQAMPDHCKDSDSIRAYRKYYNLEKRHLAVWTNRVPPKWYDGVFGINNTVNSKGNTVCRYTIMNVDPANTDIVNSKKLKTAESLANEIAQIAENEILI